MTLFHGRYSVESSRNQRWDYRSPGYYFITICTKHRTNYFGVITNCHIDLSPIGKIAAFELLKTTEVRPDVGLDEWVIMPNHVHLIFRVLLKDSKARGDADTNGLVTPGFVDVPGFVETHCNASLQTVGTTRVFNHFGPQSRNIPSVVRGFKSAVKRWTNLYGLPFEWQSRYHDRIIRDEEELHRIHWYIRKNPLVWRSDVFYQE